MRKPRRQSKPSPRKEAAQRIVSQESGYILLAVLFLVVMVLISLSVAAPKMAAEIERDREIELIHRGQQYVRAIKLYYKRFHAYPPTMEALEKTNEIRFLRKRYKDPMTGKDDWHLIHFGENKTPSYGFFGQPITGAGGSLVVGAGPSSGTPILGPGGASNPAGGPLFGGTQMGGTPSTSGTGTDAGTANSGTSTGSGSGDNSGSSASGSSPSSGSGNDSNPLTVGGLGIIGVESTSPKPSILVWKKMAHYNQWEFWYDPLADRGMMLSNPVQPNPGGNVPGQNGAPGFNGGPATPQPSQPPQPTQPPQ